MRRLALLTVILLGISAQSADAFVYWANSQNMTIGRADNDGSAVDDSFIHTGALPFAVAIDATHIYWANQDGESIGRANLDGTGADNSFITGINEPSGVAVNEHSIFWSTVGGAIGRADIDGSNVNAKFITGLGGACGVGLDSGHVYWATDHLAPPGLIGRAGLSGSSVEPEYVKISGSSTPCGVVVNSANIFWSDPGFLGPNGTQIGRANTSTGEGVDASFIGEAQGPCGVALDGESHLYWANAKTGTIGRANTDGTQVNQSLITTGTTEPCGVAVNALSSPPAPAPVPVPVPAPPAGQVPNTKPPQTTIVAGPGKKLRKGKATFRFSSSEAGSSFECKLDATKASRCASPRHLGHLKPGRHTFQVWAIDAAGNRDPTPATRRFRVPR